MVNSAGRHRIFYPHHRMECGDMGMTENDGRVCPFCDGSGRCSKCRGAGLRSVRRRWFSFEHLKACRVCEGTGTCQLCAGRGRLRSAQ